MALHQWFIPHKDTHKKAHLLSWEGLVIYIMIFILLQVGFSIVGYTKPGVMGISSSVDYKKLIELTNQQRQEMGLNTLGENEALNKAAQLKAQNMFSEGYWAHFAPSGKTPWDFILGSGYKFTFAGENLAKNFYNSEDVVEAWMSSKTHKENLLNPKYKEIGIAVVEGVLDGQKTTLVVQMFGTTDIVTSKPLVDVGGQEIEISPKDYLGERQLVASVNQANNVVPLFDPYTVIKTAGFSIVAFMTILLLLDLYILRKRGVFRLSSHHVAHMSILSIASAGLYFTNPGSIL